MKQSTGEKGASLLFFFRNPSWRIAALVTFLVISISSGFYIWYSLHTSDAAPDSIAGYIYAILGTAFLLLATILYSLRRRSRRTRSLGRLNHALHWHISFAIIGVALLFMHSFGNFNPRTGTYALYGLIALVISGIIGRALDRLVPRLIAQEVHKALNAQGEDRVETLSQQLQAIVAHNSETLTSLPTSSLSRTKIQAEANLTSPLHRLDGASEDSPFTPLDFEAQPLHTSWDLAYISLEATPQELDRVVARQRLIPDQQSALTRPVALLPGAQEHISQLRKVQRAMQREQCYRYIIRYWRLLHIALALLTLALLTWHLIYAAQLLLH